MNVFVVILEVEDRSSSELRSYVLGVRASLESAQALANKDAERSFLLKWEIDRMVFRPPEGTVRTWKDTTLFYLIHEVEVGP